MKKGFTLIELLAVIVILAVIALIATPIVLNVVENTREEARKQSVIGYADAIRLSYIEEEMNETGIPLDELATSKLQGNKVSCNISKFDNRYGSMLYGCGVIENEERIGNYCYLSGKVYEMDKAECGTVSNIIATGAIPYKKPSTELLSQIPNGTEYAQSKEIKIKYPSLMIIEEHYFIKSSEGIELNNVIGKCGSSTTPSSCEENNDTIIESNTWYQLSGDTTFTTNSNLTIEAVTGKEEEFGEKYTYEVTNIDTTIPNTSIASISTKTDRAVVSATCNDTESGITKYEFSSDNGSTWVNKGATSSHTFTGLTHGTSYTFKVRCTNGSLLTNEDEETKATLTASNPTITQLSQTPSSGEYARERVIRITYNGTGIENPSYYYSLDGNDWTSVSGTTKDVTFTSNGYLYAKTVDETGNTANAATYTVANIDSVAPTVSASVSGKVATFTMSDNIGIVGYGVNSSTTVEPTYTTVTTTTSTTITWNASQAGDYVVWVKDVAGRVSNASFSISSSAFCQYNPGTVVAEFNYTGGVQTFIAPCDGIYKLEVWGAQGGTATGTLVNNTTGTAAGGKGGYSYGNKSLSKNNILYVVVGGVGKTSITNSATVHSYNGGGRGVSSNSYSRKWYCSGGGGATHIATETGVLSSLSNSKSSVLIVAGGGGGSIVDSGGCGTGAADCGYAQPDIHYGGAGGGTTGSSGTGNSSFIGTGGTQSSGAAFGNGGYYNSTGSSVAGGGGGYYGGGSASYYGAAGGGSGYIGGVTNGSTQSGQRSGNGYARITFVSMN